MSAEAIANLRAKFETELSANGSEYHPIDIERVRTEEWQVKRFIMDNEGNEDKAFSELVRVMKWKKSYGIHDRNDQYFPTEFWQLNAIEINGKDNQGRTIQWEVLKNQKSYPETMQHIQNFIAHCVERLDRAAGEAGFILITDTNGSGISNVDMEIAKFKINVIENYPLGLRGMYVVDQPWLLNAIMKIIVGFMSEKLKPLVNYIKSSELKDFIDPAFIPSVLGGLRDKNEFPPNTVKMDRATQFGWDEKFLDKFYKAFKLQRSA